MDNGKAHAGAFASLFGGEEGIKNSVAYGIGNAAASILDRKHDIFTRAT